jgi:predicted kinase
MKKKKMDKKLILMVGVPGSGKSYWLNSHKDNFKSSYIVISRDDIRFSMLKEGEDYFSHEKEVFKEYVRQIKEALNNYDEVYADATHLNEASRSKLLRALGNDLKSIKVQAVVIQKTLQQCLIQNEQRTGLKYVPRNQIRRMYSSFTIPTFEEGFDKIFVVNKNNTLTVRVP